MQSRRELADFSVQALTFIAPLMWSAVPTIVWILGVTGRQIASWPVALFFISFTPVAILIGHLYAKQRNAENRARGNMANDEVERLYGRPLARGIKASLLITSVTLIGWLVVRFDLLSKI